MPPPPHYLDRLQRLSRSEAALAIELARDASAVRAFLVEARTREPSIPPSDRYALPLSAGAKSPVLLVAEDGGAVTCLSSDMEVKAPVVPHAMVRSFADALASSMQAALALRRSQGSADAPPDALVRLMQSPWSVTTEDWALLEKIAVLMPEALLESVRDVRELFEKDLAGIDAGLSRAWWPRYLTAAHAMMLGGPRLFSTETVVFQTAAPDVYLSARAMWCAARRGSAALDVLENLARKQGLVGGEHELAVAVALEQPLLSGRVRAFVREFKHKEGAGYLQLLEKAIEDPRSALNLGAMPLLPLLPSIVEPEAIASDPSLEARALVEKQRAVKDAHTKSPVDVAKAMHPRLHKLVQRWLGDDGLPIWKAIQRGSMLRPNSFPFGTLLFARAPRESLLPDGDAWGIEQGSDYMRHVMTSFVPRRPVMTSKPGPNSPCHCGSGKKYKKCHMREDEK